ncbi:MAG: hypothetical protein EOO61_03525 [Hymenobacter sp.]|nr:MAG: hypothetical protein EOO61_03525 [Hymenobacter sp.]
MNPLSQEEAGFTEKMSEELLLLQRQAEAGHVSSSFPWDRYNYLRRAEHEHTQSFRVVKRPYPGDVIPEVSHNQIQGREANESVDEILLSTVPQLTSAPAAYIDSVVEKKQIVAPALETICTGADVDKQRTHVAKIDAMMTYTKGKVWERYHGAAAAAVYKVAVWLGMVYSDVTFPQWGAVLLDRYGISVSEPISRYRIDKPQASSSPFRKAVLAAFSFAQSNSAILAKKHPLPAIYNHIPAETGIYPKQVKSGRV